MSSAEPVTTTETDQAGRSDGSNAASWIGIVGTSLVGAAMSSSLGAYGRTHAPTGERILHNRCHIIDGAISAAAVDNITVAD